MMVCVPNDPAMFLIAFPTVVLLIKRYMEISAARRSAGSRHDQPLDQDGLFTSPDLERPPAIAGQSIRRWDGR